MILLRRVLQVQAAVWFAGSLVLGLFPVWALETVASQGSLREYAWLRGSAVMGVVLSLLMVLVSRKLDEVWWWAWAFAILEAGVATVSVLNAAFGLPPGSAAWPWWALAGTHLVIGAGLLLGLARAGQEQPIA
jgi:hypothetical protein